MSPSERRAAREREELLFEVRFFYERGDDGLAGVERCAGRGPFEWAQEQHARLVAQGASAWLVRVARDGAA